MRAFLAMLALLLAVPALAADAPAIIQAGQNPSAFRDAIHPDPSHYTPDDFQAAGDGVKSFSSTYDLPATASPTLRMLATYQLDGVTINCTGAGNNTTTITLPAGSMPLMLGGATSMRVQIASCPGLTNAQVNSISGSGVGPYTLTTDLSSTGAFSGTGTVVFDPTSMRGGTDTTAGAQTPQWWHYGAGSISGATLTMPANTFNIVRDVTQQNASGLMSTYIAIDDPAGVCPQYRGTILSAADTAHATLSPAPTCIPAGPTLAIWSADLMFPADVATGHTFPGVAWSCRFWRSGASSLAVVLSVGSYVDPFHVTLTGTPGTAVTAFTTELECGTPDDTALDNTAIAAFNAGYGSIFAPPGKQYFMAADTAVVDLAKVNLCSDGYFTGRLLWTNLLNFTRCTPTRGQPQMRRTIDPKVHLAHSLTVSGRPIKAAMVGDSLFQTGSNGMGDVGSGVTQLNDWLSTSLGKPVNFFEYNIGGTLLANLAPNSGLNVSGNGIGIPTAPQIATTSAWYTNSGQKWIDYVKGICPDVVFIEFGNDGGNLWWSSFVDVNGYMNSAAWQTACGYTPDIIYIPSGGNGASAYATGQMEGFYFEEDFLRSAVLAGDTMPPGITMGSGGAVGILDFGHSYNAKRYGYDQWAPQMTRAVDVTPGGSANTTALTWPYKWPRPVRNLQLSTQFKENGTANLTTATFFNTNLGGALNFPLSGGENGTPWLMGGQSSPAQIAYSGNELQIQRDAGGNIAVTGYTFRVTESPASCSITSGAAILTCTTAIANGGFYYANIIVQGAGAATCPTDMGGSNCLFTTIAAGGVNNTGKILTLVANASATLTNAPANLVIYRTFLPYTITGVSAQINNGSDGSPVCAQCGFTVGIGFRVVGPIAELQNHFAFANGLPIFNGPVVRFGGKYTPTFTAGISGTVTPPSQFNAATLGQNAEDADDSTEWTPTLGVDADCWGQSPGYVGPKGGGYSGHMTAECLRHAFGDVLAANSFSVVDPYSAGVKVVAAAAGSTTIPNGATWLNLVPAGTIASFTVNLPALPSPNLPVTISTTQTITTLTVASALTINGAPTSLAANAATTFRFDQASQSWNRMQ